jgi:hypothetical protein
MSTAFNDGRNAALDAIKKIHRGGPQRPDSLTKRAPVTSSRAERLGKEFDQAAFRLAKLLDQAGMKPLPGLELRPHSGVGAEATDQIRRIHAGGARRTISLPPQDVGIIGGSIADTGAANNRRDEIVSSAVPTRIGPLHAAPTLVDRLPPTQDDATLAAIKALHRAGPKSGP